jgi:hypothetical protein
MDVTHITKRDDELLAPLVQLKAHLLWFLMGAEQYQQDPERGMIPAEALLSYPQLEYGADNLIRILLMGRLAPEMRGEFRSQVDKLTSHRLRIEQTVLQELAEGDREHFAEVVQSSRVTEGDVFRNAIEMMREDHGLDVVFSGDEIVVGLLTDPERAHLESLEEE